jgi:hypothetical protein
MLSDIVYGLGNQQEWGWLQDITIFSENHNAILFITQGVVMKKFIHKANGYGIQIDLL